LADGKNRRKAHLLFFGEKKIPPSEARERKKQRAKVSLNKKKEVNRVT